MTPWKKLESNIARPMVFEDKREFREQHSTVFAKNQLYFFGRLSVSPSSDNYHETTLLGGFVSVYDLHDKKWSFIKIDKVDENESHRDHVFAVNDLIFMYVYSTSDQTYQKLYNWQNSTWQEVQLKLKFEVPKDASWEHHRISETKDGFYILYEQAGQGHVAKMHLSVDGGHFKSAELSHVAETSLFELGNGAHFTGVAYNDKKMFIWYGQQGCGFRWIPKGPLKLDFGKTPLSFERVSLPENQPGPPYSYGGPSRTLMDDRNRWIMLGGSVAKGMSQVRDCDEIWTFDVDQEVFSKSSVEMPSFSPKWRVTMAHDFNTGDVYICDLENGIYVANTKSI